MTRALLQPPALSERGSSRRPTRYGLLLLGNFDTGGFTVNYSAGRRHGSSCVELGMVSRDGKLRS